MSDLSSPKLNRIKDATMPSGGSRGKMLSFIALGVFFLVTFVLFLYHSHIQLGILHGLGGDFTTNKQFIFNNLDIAPQVDPLNEVINISPKVVSTDDIKSSRN